MKETERQPDPDPIREALWLIVDREYDIPTNEAMRELDALHAHVAELEAERAKSVRFFTELAEANEIGNRLSARVAELEAGIRAHWDETTNGVTANMLHADSKLHALIGL